MGDNNPICPICGVIKSSVEAKDTRIEQLEAENARLREEEDVPDRVSIHGMYDNHTFHKYTASSVDDLINQWLAHIKTPGQGQYPDGTIVNLGPTSLCPATVLSGKKEIRRVGEMVFVDYKTLEPDRDMLEAYRQALLNDPDIPRLLSATTGEGEG